MILDFYYTHLTNERYSLMKQEYTAVLSKCLVRRQGLYNVIVFCSAHLVPPPLPSPVPPCAPM